MTSPRCCSSWSRSRHRVWYYRFHGLPALSESSIRGLIGLDGRAATTLVAESGGRIVAFAGYHRNPPCLNRAEVAFAVSDAFQGHGIGTRLLEQLAKAARQRRDRYVRCVRDRRQPAHARRVPRFGLRRDRDRRKWRLPRGPLASRHRAFVGPRRGAVPQSPRPRRCGRSSSPASSRWSAPAANAGRSDRRSSTICVAAGFTGTVVPVHPTAAEIGGLTALSASRPTSPVAVDLAIDRRPSRQGPRGGRRLHQQERPGDLRHQRRLQRMRRGRSRARGARCSSKVRRAGCRLIGPNCMGLLNTDPAVRLNATFSPVYPPRGRRRDVHAERRAGAGDPRLRQAARHRHLELRLGRQQGRRLGQRSDSVLGRRSRTRRSSCSTSRASETRRSSARLHGASRGRSRSSR